jgi:hypothetical protein
MALVNAKSTASDPSTITFSYHARRRSWLSELNLSCDLNSTTKTPCSCSCCYSLVHAESVMLPNHEASPSLLRQQSPQFTHFINLPQAVLYKKTPILIIKQGTRGCTKYSDLLLFLLSRADCSCLFPVWIGSNSVFLSVALTDKHNHTELIYIFFFI